MIQDKICPECKIVYCIILYYLSLKLWYMVNAWLNSTFYTIAVIHKINSVTFIILKQKEKNMSLKTEENVAVLYVGNCWQVLDIGDP